MAMRKRKLKHNLIRFGVAWLLRVTNRTPRVLFYHGVDQVDEEDSLHIFPDAFEQEMQFLLKHYEVISIEEFEQRFFTNHFSGREIVVTFDDGYQNNLTHAAPVLQSLRIPFTVFISTAHVESGDYFPTAIARMIIRDSQLQHLSLDCLKLQMPLRDASHRKSVCEAVIQTLKHSNILFVKEICRQLIANVSTDEYQNLCERHHADKPLTWEDVQCLHENYGATIGSHCLQHFICNDYQTEEEITRQLTESKRIIENHLETDCRYLAYPNGVYNAGDVNSFAIQAAEKARYKLAFTTVTDRLHPNFNPMLMPRLAARFEMEDFIVKLGLKPKYH